MTMKKMTSSDQRNSPNDRSVIRIPFSRRTVTATCDKAVASTCSACRAAVGDPGGAQADRADHDKGCEQPPRVPSPPYEQHDRGPCETHGADRERELEPETGSKRIVFVLWRAHAESLL